MNDWAGNQLKALIAEDDLDLLNVIGLALHNAGFAVEKVTNGRDALLAFKHDDFSLVVLDINMPHVNGLQVCREIRETSNVPVLMLSARDQERDLLDALDVGADAYVMKPFSPRILVARIRALLRRSLLNEQSVFRLNQTRLDVEGLTLSQHEQTIQLTKLETRLLRLLITHGNTVVTRKTLINEVWDTYSTANRNMLKQVIFRLRRKLVVAPDALNSLVTAPDGYMWKSQPTGGETTQLSAHGAPASAV